MGSSTDPYLNQLEDAWVAARRAEIPDLKEIRAAKDRIIVYLAQCVIEEMDRMAAQEPVEPRQRRRWRLISNDGPVRHNPRSMSSPLKTDEIRAFEARVNLIFGINATTTTEWPGEPDR